jgi:formamidopyrimidine-DNA glycosylase
MPELPEVETTRRGLLPLLTGQRIREVQLRNRQLRWPIPAQLPKLLVGRTINGISRRGKYLLWDVDSQDGGGFLLCHLGMSGSLVAHQRVAAPGKHDHVDIVVGASSRSVHTVRYNDPRRFGAMLWIEGPKPQHALLDHLGPEPLSDSFDAAYLYAQSRGRSVSIKSFIMNAEVVVGVGNIYASEALFRAGIRPTQRAGRITLPRLAKLVDAIRATLSDAIRAGGSTLRDYVKADGESGCFQLHANVYGRAGLPCTHCGSAIRQIVQGQRSTYYCPRCQT